MVETILNLANTILKMFNSFVERKRFKKDLIAKIILYRLSLKYLPDGYDFTEIKKQERFFGDNIRVYLGKDLYDAYVNNSKNIYWTARYKSEFNESVIEESLESFIAVAKSKKLLRKDF